MPRTTTRWPGCCSGPPATSRRRRFSLARRCSSALMKQRTRSTSPSGPMTPTYHLDDPGTDVFVGDCRAVLASLPAGSVDLVFADPPFNWDVQYGEWDDARPREEYLAFTHAWLDGCIRVLKDEGSLWVNIPDDTAAEIVVHLKS